MTLERPMTALTSCINKQDVACFFRINLGQTKREGLLQSVNTVVLRCEMCFENELFFDGQLR